MLILNRYNGEKITIGKNQEITITIKAVKGRRVSLGIEAPPHCPIVRDNARKSGRMSFIQDRLKY